MSNEYSAEDLVDFLSHASDRGLIPAATAQSLAVAVRNVLSVLSVEERADVRTLDLDAVVKRFTNKRAKDFNPSSLKEYGRRLHRAVQLFKAWREDPANFTVKTRSTANSRRAEQKVKPEAAAIENILEAGSASHGHGGYQSAFPIRPGTVVTISNVPSDLTAAEAERLAQFVRMLAVE